MPASAGGGASADSSPVAPPRRRCQPRDVDSLIRELQQINLAQCLNQLQSDISQLGGSHNSSSRSNSANNTQTRGANVPRGSGENTQQTNSSPRSLSRSTQTSEPRSNHIGFVVNHNSEKDSVAQRGNDECSYRIPGTGSSPNNTQRNKNSVTPGVATQNGASEYATVLRRNGGVKTQCDQNMKPSVPEFSVNDVTGGSSLPVETSICAADPTAEGQPKWRGLYVKCSAEVAEEDSVDPADKKSSSGYSTESASPPGSRNTSDEASPGGAPGPSQAIVDPGQTEEVYSEVREPPAAEQEVELCCETEVKRRMDLPVGLLNSPTELASSDRSRYHSVRLLRGGPITGHHIVVTSPLVSDHIVVASPFQPTAASTPTQPRSPKTLRFAATHELIPPDSPSRRQVAGGVARPRPSILRSPSPRRAVVQSRQDGGSSRGSLRRTGQRGQGSRSPSPRRIRVRVNGTVEVNRGRSGGAAGSVRPRSGETPEDVRSRAGGSAEVSRVVSALSRLEADLSQVQRCNGTGTYGTAQFVPGARQQRAPLPPPAPLDPLVIVSGRASDTDDSEDDTSAAARRHAEPELPARADSPPPRRRTKLPPRHNTQLKPAKRRPLSWLLGSCSSSRRATSPTTSTPHRASSASAETDLPPIPYRCNLCNACFVELFPLVAHVHERHLRVQVRPKYSCGLCPARFYASRVLVKHCAYHHNSLGGERREHRPPRMRRVV